MTRGCRSPIHWQHFEPVANAACIVTLPSSPMNALFNKATLLAGIVTLLSCSAGEPEAAAPKPPVPQAQQQVRAQPNPRYQSPRTQVVPQNPGTALSSQIPSGIGITHSYGDRSKPFIAMTFDDGPHPKNTPRLLDILKARNIKATFYVIGENVQRYPEIARRIVSEGHEIANHTWTHANLTKLSDTALRKELVMTRDAIVSATGVLPRTMRPPYGALRQSQREMIFREFGYPTIMWAVDPQDWKRPGVSVVTSRILNSTRNGAIVLAHDLHAPTISAMPGTFDGLLNKGFRFVTVSQLLAMKGSSVAGSGQSAAPADAAVGIELTEE